MTWIGFLLLSLQTFAAENASVCVNGNPDNRGLIHSLARAKDPLTRAFIRQRKQLRDPAAASDPIDLACIRMSLSFSGGDEGYVCDGNRWRRVGPADPERGPCISNEVAEFIHFSVNSALRCFSTPSEPIDPAFIFRKYHNESAFHFYLHSEGGSGLGQMTSIAVEDMNNRNREFLDALIDSEKPDCQPFRKILQSSVRDDDYQVRAPGEALCPWVSTSGGIARNLIYSLSLYKHLRYQVVEPALRRINPAFLKNPQFVHAFVTIGYGPDGENGAKRAIAREVRKKTRFVDLDASLRRHYAYYRSTRNKWNQAQKQLRRQHRSLASCFKR